MSLILSIDIGTTNIKTFLVNQEGEVIYRDLQQFSTIYPREGWVEQSPVEIYSIIKDLCLKAIEKYGKDIIGIGITNQRATSVLWRKDGEPIYNAITWMDTRGNIVREKLRKELGDLFNDIEIFLNPNASSMYIRWVLDNVAYSREEAEKGNLLFGTLNTYVIWRLTKGEIFATDPSNAIATGLFEPFTDNWFEDLFEILDIPINIMPTIKDNIDEYGEAKDIPGNIAIYSSIGDQQAALFGEACFNMGDLKVTHGTGSFIDVNIGGEFTMPTKGLLPLTAWKYRGIKSYMMEGYIYNTGGLVDWMIQNNFLKDYEELNNIEMIDDKDLYLVPALTGLGAPYWDSQARGLLIGLSKDVNREDIIRAGLEGIAFRVLDIINLIREELSIEISLMRVDGGLARSDYLQQFMADITGIDVERPAELETSGLGAAYMAGLGAGLYSDIKEIIEVRKVDKVFKPSRKRDWASKKYEKWREAVNKALGWSG
jgi:glycerol kinase